MAKTIRLDKFLAEMKLGTRSQVKELIRKGAILVNGEACKSADLKIIPEEDQVIFEGNRIDYAKMEYYMLNKPSGVISATEDPFHRTVIDLIHSAKRKDLFPVGRLDLDTEGLLLITNDGKLAHNLLSPKKHIDKVYFARVEGKLPDNAPAMMAAGLTLKDGTPVLPAKLLIQSSYEIEKEDESSYVYETEITIREGRFHQVKRMFEALGGNVIFLKRLSMGPLHLDPLLKLGEYRPLTEEECTLLKEGRNETGEAIC